MRGLRVATFNVRHALRDDAVVDTDALATSCASFDADVIALQEVDRWAWRSRFADQAARVGEACESAHVFGPATRQQVVGRYGNALVVRGAILHADVMVLPRLGRSEARTVILATVEVGGRRSSVAATHLSRDRGESEAQLGAIVHALVRRPPPRILLGDLNRRPHEVEPVLAAHGLRPADAPPTYPADHPELRIDWVAVDGLDIAEVSVVRQPVSDHRPLVVDLTPERFGG